MTRSFDRRAFAGPPYVMELAMSVGLDCSCEKNDPDCAECWVPVAEHTANMAAAISSGGSFEKMRNPYVDSPYIGDVARSGPASISTTSTNPKPSIQEQQILSQFDRDVRYRFDECLELLLRKHKDYSGKNIAQSPGGALNGLRVRMHDKQCRINNLIDTGASPEYEPLRDSFVDLANYSIIALMCLDSVWPSE